MINTHDIYRIIGVVAGLGTIVTGQVVTQILTMFYVPSPYITIATSVIGGIITLATLVNFIISKSVPNDFNTVISPITDPTPASITTKTSLAATQSATVKASSP